MTTLETDTLCDFRSDDGAGPQAKQWYYYLGLRLRLQQGELFDFHAATSVFGDA